MISNEAKGVSEIELSVIIMAVLFLLLILKHIQLKKQIRNLSKQIMEVISGNSEKMLDISLIDRDLEQLAGILNEYNAGQRQTVARALRHEEHLKESIVNISHDLRTPLTVILGHLQLLIGEDLKTEQKQRVEIILRKAERMKDLAESFYDLSVMDAGQMNPRKEKINLSNLLINLIAENAPAFERRDICPKISIPQKSVFLSSDRSMLERIIQNLLTNALRYSAGTVRISLCQRGDGSIGLCMENPVLDSVELNPDRLFERFYTGDRSRNRGGTGMGLAVVKLLTEKLGGKVAAQVQSDRLVITLDF